MPSYQPITASERGRWFLTSTIGPTSLLLAGPLSAAIGTARDIPSEYATRLGWFRKTDGMRLTGIATGNLMEAKPSQSFGRTPDVQKKILRQ